MPNVLCGSLKAEFCFNYLRLKSSKPWFHSSYQCFPSSNKSLVRDNEWYVGWAIGMLCGCQRSCPVCSFCGCVLNSVHFINDTFTFTHYNMVVMFCNPFHLFSRLSECIPLSKRSGGDATPPHHLVSELVWYGADYSSVGKRPTCWERHTGSPNTHSGSNNKNYIIHRQQTDLYLGLPYTEDTGQINLDNVTYKIDIYP